jgi:hypothetical protein
MLLCSLNQRKDAWSHSSKLIEFGMEERQKLSIFELPGTYMYICN